MWTTVRIKYKLKEWIDSQRTGNESVQQVLARIFNQGSQEFTTIRISSEIKDLLDKERTDAESYHQTLARLVGWEDEK